MAEFYFLMYVEIQQIGSELLPLAIRVSANLVGVAAVLGIYHLGLSVDRTVFMAIMFLGYIFWISEYFAGIQIQVLIVLGVVGIGFLAAMMLRRACVQARFAESKSV
ncbi:hypothetical protein [Phyllobacterium myrsinacearum]|uniref:Membrane-bound ClpP family serine protease n=1 Tax=Phyllobacterium myrsinacearum TaxID=28101 RepID=A0A839EUF0_9HYPH|nr:hypothetical protein [Phyllobacterium myrsinacearum]MBA8881808.1 membrane-bound ClpP family serine protease [Phyllobacterium myrsinacearum]